MISRGDFAEKLCKRLGLKASQRRMNALVAWETAEGTNAKFNPLATTKAMPGATDWNSTGVKNFASLSDGLTATVQTLEESGHGYEPIVKRLRDNAPAREILQAVANSDWGTSGSLLAKVLPEVKADYESSAAKLIGQ